MKIVDLYAGKSEFLDKLKKDIFIFKNICTSGNLCLCVHPEIMNLVKKESMKYQYDYAVSINLDKVFFEGLEVIQNPRIYPYFIQENIELI